MRRRILILFLFIFPAGLFSAHNDFLNGNVISCLYFKNLNGIESRLKKAGLLRLNRQQKKMAMDFISDIFPALQNYNSLLGLENGNFIKNTVGDLYVLNYRNNRVIVARLKSGSAILARLMSLIKSGGKWQNYSVAFKKDAVVLCSSERILDNYLSDRQKITDPVLLKQIAKKNDFFFYKKASSLQGVFDTIVYPRNGKKSIAGGFNIKTLSMTFYYSSSTEQNNLKRTSSLGYFVPQNSLFYMDSLRKASSIISPFFGKSVDLSPLNKYFEPHIGIVLENIDINNQPSYYMILTGNKTNGDREDALKKLFLQLFGDESFQMTKENDAVYYTGKRSGMVFMKYINFYLIGNNLNSLRNALKTFTGKKASIWDNPQTSKLQKLENSKSAFYIRMDGLSGRVVDFIVKHYNPEEQNKKAIIQFLKGFYNLRTIVGFEKSGRSYQYFYFRAKPKK